MTSAELATHAPVLPPGWPAMSIAEAHARLTAPGQRFEIETVTVRGVTFRSWKHQPATTSELFQIARGYRERLLLIYEDERITYDAFARAALKFAEELRAQDIRKGDRVAIAMRNLPEWVVAYFGAALCGAIVVPLNAWWTAAELEYALNDSGASNTSGSALSGNCAQWCDLPMTSSKCFTKGWAISSERRAT